MAENKERVNCLFPDTFKKTCFQGQPLTRGTAMGKSDDEAFLQGGPAEMYFVVLDGYIDGFF